MSDTPATPEPASSDPATSAAEVPEVVEAPAPAAAAPPQESVDSPAKVMRVGTMLKQLLEEVRTADLDEASRDRLRDIYETSVAELGSSLSPDLREELSRLALPFTDDDVPSAMELQIAQAQLVGWLEGLIQGIQATMFAQQMMAQQQFEQLRGQLQPGQRPPGQMGRPGPGGQAPGAPAANADVADVDDRPGTYL